MEHTFCEQTFSPFNNLKHVFKSDKLKVDNQKIRFEKEFHGFRDSNRLVVCKYTKLSNLIESVNEKSFYFSSPEKWLDPFEMLFFQPRVKILGQKDVVLHACCFSCNDIDNEEGFWEIWSKDESEPIVRVTYDVNKLLTSLNGQAGNLYSFYLGGVLYLSRKTILNLYRKESHYSYNTIYEYINKLCIKRNSYKYENELRLFVKTNKAYNDNNEYTVIKNINYNDGVVAEITLPPAKPFGNNNPARDKMREYQECINAQTFQKLHLLISNGSLKCKINQSALYCTNTPQRTYSLQYKL